MNNEQARVFIRSYLGLVKKLHPKKEGGWSEPLNDEDRCTVNEELEMDDAKARACRKFGRVQLKKSIALAKEGLLLQSIDKAEQAMYLRPDDPKPLVMLMRLYMPKYRNRPEYSNLYAQRVLVLDPSHQNAQELIQTRHAFPRSRYLIASSIAACVVFGGLLYTQEKWIPSVEAFITASNAGAHTDSGIVDTGTKDQDDAEQGATELSVGNNEGIPKNSALPISLEGNMDGLVLEDRGSTWYSTEKSLTYDLRAVLHNRSSGSYGVITGTVSVLDENDLPIIQKFQELHTFYELPLHPQQSHPLSLRLYASELPELMPTPTRVIVEIQDTNIEPVPEMKMIDIPIDWKPPKESTQSIQIQQRPYAPENTEGKWTHAAAFEITNTGSDIHRLKLGFSFLDEEKKEQASTETLVTFTDRPKIFPKEIRVVTVRETTSKPVGAIQVSILELD